MDRPDWETYFQLLAFAVARRADCSRRKVGAVLVGPDHRVISTGYNGSPPGGPSCLAGECPRASSAVLPGGSYDTGPGSCIAVHAEANALLYADPSRFAGATMYVTDRPCDGCQRLLDGAGVTAVVAR